MSEPSLKRRKSGSRTSAPAAEGPDQEYPDVPLGDVFLTSHLPFKRKASVFISSKKQYWKRLKQILAAEQWPEDNQPTYATIDAPPSVYPSKRFCDLTGVEAKYVDPKTKLRYASADQYAVIRSLPDDVVQAHLAVRNANVVIR